MNWPFKAKIGFPGTIDILLSDLSEESVSSFNFQNDEKIEVVEPVQTSFLMFGNHTCHVEFISCTPTKAVQKYLNF